MEYYAATEKNEVNLCIGVGWLPRHNVKCKGKCKPATMYLESVCVSVGE